MTIEIDIDEPVIEVSVENPTVTVEVVGGQGPPGPRGDAGPPGAPGVQGPQGPAVPLSSSVPPAMTSAGAAGSATAAAHGDHAHPGYMQGGTFQLVDMATEAFKIMQSGAPKVEVRNDGTIIQWSGSSTLGKLFLTALQGQISQDFRLANRPIITFGANASGKAEIWLDGEISAGGNQFAEGQKVKPLVASQVMLQKSAEQGTVWGDNVVKFELEKVSGAGLSLLGSAGARTGVQVVSPGLVTVHINLNASGTRLDLNLDAPFSAPLPCAPRQPFFTTFGGSGVSLSYTFSAVAGNQIIAKVNSAVDPGPNLLGFAGQNHMTVTHIAT